MKKVLFVVLLFLGLFFLIGNVYADSTHTCQGNSCNGGGGGNTEIGIINAPIFASTYDPEFNPTFKPTVIAEGGEGGTGVGIGVGIGGKGGEGGAGGNATSSSTGVFDNRFEIKQEFQRPVMESIQPNNTAMPLVQGDVWDYASKMGEVFAGKEIAKPEIKEIITYEYVFDPLSPMMYRKMRSYDVEKKLLGILKEKGSAIVKIKCYDGSDSGGLPIFLGGGGTDYTGLATITGSMMPTKNWSNANPVCVIIEYVK
jgi:hypothetical protein